MKDPEGEYYRQRAAYDRDRSHAKAEIWSSFWEWDAAAMQVAKDSVDLRQLETAPLEIIAQLWLSRTLAE